LRRLRDHLGPELGDELPFDLALRVAGADPRGNEDLHPARDRRARLVDRLMARRADDLAFELPERRMPLACGGHGREGERGQHDGEQLHPSSALWMAAASVSFVTAPGTCATTLPARSMKNDSGAPVTPHLESRLPFPSRPIGSVRPNRRTNLRASPATSR